MTGNRTTLESGGTLKDADGDGATISPRGDSGTGTVPADRYSFDNAGGMVTFRDGSYCIYPERQFFPAHIPKSTSATIIKASKLPWATI